MSSWMIWMSIGIIMLVTEIFMPGIFICFFGIGAIVTGIIGLFFPELPLIWMMVIFAVLGTLFAISGKRMFCGKISKDKDTLHDIEDFTGEWATITQTITPGKDGKVEFRGSFWNAAAETEIAAGTKVRIIKRENLTLTVTDKQ